MSRTWSTYQQAIFSHVADARNGNLIVEAVAGSGKTTTIVEATKRVKGTVLFLAFNKSIATELKQRGVNARTYHSLCFGPVLSARKQTDVTTDKLRRLVAEAMAAGHVTEQQEKLYGAIGAKLVGLARQSGIGTHLMADTADAWFALVDHHGLELDDEAANMDDAVAFARNLLTTSNNDARVDFDDLLYIAVKEGLSLPKYDVAFVDEAQDTNAIQRELLRKVMRNAQARIIAVGDPAQAIYGFRGADSESLNNIAREFNAKRLPLSVSYRCGQAIVDVARAIVPHIEAREGAHTGTVVDFGTKWNIHQMQAGDLVVCRTTKPLVALGYKMLKARKPVHIMGKDIGEGLVALINRMKAKGVDMLQLKLEAYKARECAKLIAAKNEAKAEAVADKVDALLCVIEGTPETERTVPGVIAAIRSLFSDKADAVVLATIHKAKGLEADRVFWLNSKKVIQWATQPWQQQQEANLRYVAITRAKDFLGLIEEGGQGMED